MKEAPQSHEYNSFYGGGGGPARLDYDGLAINPRLTPTDSEPTRPDAPIQPHSLDFAVEQVLKLDPTISEDMALSTTRTIQMTDKRQMDDYADDAEQD